MRHHTAVDAPTNRASVTILLGIQICRMQSVDIQASYLFTSHYLSGSMYNLLCN